MGVAVTLQHVACFKCFKRHRIIMIHDKVLSFNDRTDRVDKQVDMRYNIMK